MPTVPTPRFVVPPAPFHAVAALRHELGLSDPLAQVMVRRGHGTPEVARAWLEADEEHDPALFEGMADALALVRTHLQRGSAITVHGDYDVDGVCSTAILVSCLRGLGARVDWYLPGRREDGYGLSAVTVERLAARGTGLLITVDCAITAVDEVAAARAAGIDVLVTDHHAPRADGRLPDAPIVHPGLGGYPCADLCAAAVAHKLADALRAEMGAPPTREDSDLVALATVADCVALRGENRRLVREGLRALAATPRPGLRSLMSVAGVDPSRADVGAVSFRLAPRLNAAGRLQRADAALELLLTQDEARGAAVADELDRINMDRRDVETRILFAAEAQVAEQGERSAYVLAGDDWHPGVIGIVASRIAERHHRPAVLIAFDGDSGTGSGRSISGFDLLGGLNACAASLKRHGGHRAAAGLQIDRECLDEFAAAFDAHAGRVLSAEDLVPVERVDAVVPGDVLGLELAEEMRILEPFGMGNPGVTLLVPAASFADPRPMGEGRHVRFTVESGRRRCAAVSFGSGGKLPRESAAGSPVDATFRLEVNEYAGSVSPRLVLRHARGCEPGPIRMVGEPSAFLPAALTEFDGPPDLSPRPVPIQRAPEPHDHRGDGLAGTLGALVATGEPVLAVCADVARRIDALSERVGGFALCSWAALERTPSVVDDFSHVVAIDPPALPAQRAVLDARPPGAQAHLAWGGAELRFAQAIHEREHDLRAPLADLYRALRARNGAAGEELEAVLRGTGPQSRSPALAGRLLRILAELDLVSLDRDTPAVAVPPAQRTALEGSATWRSHQRQLQDGLTYLTSRTARAA